MSYGEVWQVLEEGQANGGGSRGTEKVLVRPLTLTLFIPFSEGVQNVARRKHVTSFC